MTNSITFFRNLERAERIVDVYLNALESRKTDEYDVRENYAHLITRLRWLKTRIERLLNLYKFHRLTKGEFALKLDGKFTGNVILSHIVKDYESPQSIAKEYGISLEQLLKNNNEITTNFEAGKELKVQVENLQLHTVYDQVPVYGTQVGEKIFGVDLGDSLTANGRGDFNTIKYEDSLRQGVKNRMTTEVGDYPLIPDFGLYNIVGSEYPPELRDGMMKIKIIYQLENDPRIERVNQIEVERDENSVIYDVDMTSINKIRVKV